MKKSILILFLCIFGWGISHADVEWSLTEDGTLTISGGKMDDYNGGSSDRELPPWIYQNGKLKKTPIVKIIIEDGVTNIGVGAFRNCDKLTSITIPNSVTKIGAWAFRGSALPAIEIPNSVTEIGGGAFENCQKLTSIIIPNSVTQIGGLAFHYDFQLTSVTLSNSITSIANNTFEACTSLVSINIPNSVTSIGNKAFSACSSLTSLTIPESVTNIGGEAFGCCESLATLICYAQIPPVGINEYDEGYFNFVPTSTGSLYVPASTISAYKTANEWKYWRNIKAIEDGISTGVDNIDSDKAGDDKVYNLNGQRINGFNAQKGIYIKNGKKYAR